MDNLRQIKEKDFFQQKTPAQKIAFLLRYAILAPSTHNSQPWLFKIKNNICLIYKNPTLKLKEADPKERDLYISFGCLMENLALAADYFDLDYTLSSVRHSTSDRNLIASFRLNSEKHKKLNSPYKKIFFETIPKRLNNRGKFSSQTINQTILRNAQQLNNYSDIQINFSQNRSIIEKIAALTAKGMRVAHRQPTFRKEMSRWMHNSLTQKKDGLPGYSLKMPFFLSFIIPSLIRFFNFGPLLAKLNYLSVNSAPLVCVLGSENDNSSSWINIGQLAERIMLFFNSQNIQTSIFVAAIEIGNLRQSLQEIIKIQQKPQFLFAVGYMDNINNNEKFTPRFSVEEKFIH